MRRLKGLVNGALALLVIKKALSHKEFGVFSVSKLFTYLVTGFASLLKIAEKLIKPLVLMNFFIVRHYDYLNPKTYS